MKRLKIVLSSFALFALSLQTALAQNIQPLAAPEPEAAPLWVTLVAVLFGLLGLFLFVFWIMMLVDAIKNQTENKALWVVIIIFLGWLGAIIYYFAAKKKRA